MYKAVKYACDALFVLTLALSAILFALEFVIEINTTAVYAIEDISLVLLGSYYTFFGYDLYNAKRKLNYCKQHWILIILLALPFLPIARLARFAIAERAFWIVSDTLWHVLDEVEML